MIGMMLLLFVFEDMGFNVVFNVFLYVFELSFSEIFVVFVEFGVFDVVDFLWVC